jgi:chromosome segregation ATPase
MSESKLRDELASLERKVKLLLAEHTTLQEKATTYRRENDGLRAQLNSKNEQLTGFQNKFKLSRIVDNMTADGQDSRELKEVLDNNIKEIDKCIAHMIEA